jgi:predicted TIM-barrel fold metal-dependent hydrolase
MMIIDSQVHIWGPNTPERPWAEKASAHMAEPLTADMLSRVMDEAGVTQAILVPPSLEGDRNDLALAAAQAHPNRFAVMGRLLIDRPEARVAIERWKEQKGMLGIRLTFHRDHDRPLIDNGVADWFWPAAERLGIPIMVHAPERLPVVAAIARRHPGLTIIVDHMGFARETMDSEAPAGARRILELANLPNVSVKVSAMPCFSSEAYPFRNLHDPIRRVIDGFGPERSYWGTDYSRLPPTCTYRQAVTMFTEELGLSQSDLEWVMGKALAKRLGWPA